MFRHKPKQAKLKYDRRLDPLSALLVCIGASIKSDRFYILSPLYLNNRFVYFGLTLVKT